MSLQLSSSKDTGGQGQTVHTFQKRKVESNWEKYAEVSTSMENDAYKHGADFKQILASSGKL